MTSGQKFKRNFLTILITLCLGNTSIAVENQCPAFLTQILGQLSPQQQLKVGAILRNDPELMKDAMEIMNLLPKIQSGELSVRDPHLLELVTNLGTKLQNTGKLPEMLTAVAAQLKKAGKIPATMPEEKLKMMIAMASTVIDAELSARGLTKFSVGVKYEPWSKLGNRLTSEIQHAIAETMKKNPGKSGFENPEFVKIFEQQTDSMFTSKNEVRLLVNGTESFPLRTEKIESAKKSIRVMSWAFYDDVTGNTFANQLIKKAKEGVDVKVMVDGQIALQPIHAGTLKQMEENGVQVIRWRSTDPLRRFDGQHRKFLIVDDQELIGGGMNFGDVYSHMGPETTAKWRDTDVYIKGPAVTDAQKLYARLWNEQITNRGVIDGKTHTPLELTTPHFETTTSAKISLVNHQPGVDENIYRANLMAIEGATKTIDIENAYFILDPATYKALLRAKKRGVKVRILTNSAHSVDEPIVSYPIMESVNRLAKQDFEVYVKEGTTTLHSKALTVDGMYSWVGSHNFHPRSFRYEGEITMNVLDADFAKKVQAMIQADIDKAIRIKEPVKLPPNLQADAIGYYLYDQL